MMKQQQKNKQVRAKLEPPSKALMQKALRENGLSVAWIGFLDWCDEAGESGWTSEELADLADVFEELNENDKSVFSSRLR